MSGSVLLAAPGEFDSGHLKCYAEDQELEIITSIQKKSKHSESRMARKHQTVERLRKMSIKEICVMVTRAIYAERSLMKFHRNTRLCGSLWRRSQN